MRQIPKDKVRAEPPGSTREPLGEGPRRGPSVPKRKIFLSRVTDDEILYVAGKVIEEHGLVSRIELRRHNPMIYEAARRRGLVPALRLEDKSKCGKKEQGA